jgi:hypothetical protein
VVGSVAWREGEGEAEARRWHYAVAAEADDRGGTASEGRGVDREGNKVGDADDRGGGSG